MLGPIITREFSHSFTRSLQQPAYRRIKIFVKGVKMFRNKMDKMLIKVLSTGTLLSLHPTVELLRIQTTNKQSVDSLDFGMF